MPATEDCWCLRYHFTDLDGNEVICEHSCHDEFAAAQGWLINLIGMIVTYWLVGKARRGEIDLPGLAQRLSGLPPGLAREDLEGRDPDTAGGA